MLTGFGGSPWVSTSIFPNSPFGSLWAWGQSMEEGPKGRHPPRGGGKTRVHRQRELPPECRTTSWKTSWVWDCSICYDMLYVSDWWFGTFFIFPYIGNFIIPTDFHIFQRGRSTTNQLWYYFCLLLMIRKWRLGRQVVKPGAKWIDCQQKLFEELPVGKPNSGYQVKCSWCRERSGYKVYHDYRVSYIQ